MTKDFGSHVFWLIGFFCILDLLLNVYDQKHVSSIDGVEVTEVLHVCNDYGTVCRFLVVTEGDTFAVRPSFWNMKFHPERVIAGVKPGFRYNFVVCGIGRGQITDYRNILSYSPVSGN